MELRLDLGKKLNASGVYPTNYAARTPICEIVIFAEHSFSTSRYSYYLHGLLQWHSSIQPSHRT